MQEKTYIKNSIINNLTLLQHEELKEVEDFVEFLLLKKNINAEIDEPNTLEVIWEGLGFNKIINIDEEISALRKEFGNNLLSKTID